MPADDDSRQLLQRRLSWFMATVRRVSALDHSPVLGEWLWQLRLRRGRAAEGERSD